jgi:hypothetical protein
VRAELINVCEAAVSFPATVQRLQKATRILRGTEQVRSLLESQEIALRHDDYRIAVLSLDPQRFVILADVIKGLLEVAAKR